ncbi:hypothetical protein ACSBR1_019691 [Camellia fascicularis]
MTSAVAVAVAIAIASVSTVGDWVTAIATPIDNSDMIVTSPRDKSLIVWHLTKEDRVHGLPRRRLTGHSHFVKDVILSSDDQFALSGNWDQTVVFSKIMNPNGW